MIRFSKEKVMLLHKRIDKGGPVMEKFIPYEKLSKKKKRELNAKRRNTWGDLNPVTRKPARSRAYDRQKARKWNRDEFPTAPFLFCS